MLFKLCFFFSFEVFRNFSFDFFCQGFSVGGYGQGRRFRNLSQGKDRAEQVGSCRENQRAGTVSVFEGINLGVRICVQGFDCGSAFVFGAFGQYIFLFIFRLFEFYLINVWYRGVFQKCEFIMWVFCLKFWNFNMGLLVGVWQICDFVWERKIFFLLFLMFDNCFFF